MPRGKNPNSLANLPDRSAPDKPGETVTTGIRITPEDRDWLKGLEGGLSYHIRQAIADYRAKLGD